MFAQFAQRCGGNAASATAGDFFSQQLNGMVHTNAKDGFDVFKVGIGAATMRSAFSVLKVWTIATNVGPNHDAIFGVWTDFARQGQQAQRLFQVNFCWHPFFWNRLAWWFIVFFGDFAALHVGTKTALECRNLVTSIITQILALWRDAIRIFDTGRAEGAGVLTLWVA